VTVTAAELESFDPATGERLGTVPVTRPGEVDAIVSSIAQVQPFWAQLTLADRGRYLERMAQVVIDEADQIRDLIVREQGKPRNEAVSMEVLPSIDSLHWIAREGQQALADERVPMRQLYLKSKRTTLVYEPLGVVGVISAFNFPWSIPLAQIAQALMAGNGVVLKPASLTPLVGERIGRAFERAGLPEGLLRVVHGPVTGRAIVSSGVAKVFFTGSVQAGREVGEGCARALKDSVLELGGNDAMIVLEDADVDHAVAGALWGGFANAGQSGAGIERVYVMREIFEPFISALVSGAKRLRLDNPLRWDTEVGPLTSREHFDHVCALVDEAVADGAELRCGGPVQPPEGLSGQFFAPAVLTGVTQRMRIMREETFGPVLAIAAVESEDEAVSLANDTSLGLGASVWTGDRSKGELFARELQAGMVWINDHMFTHAAWQCPWGGVKDSGIGRTHSRFGLYECVDVKLRSWEPSRFRDPWWHPYDETLGKALQHTATMLYGRPSIRASALRHGALPLMRLGVRLLKK
jgi:succinate-semialdehyde dehydrogenase/glutarate-semialdehyde dehydrogenase